MNKEDQNDIDTYQLEEISQTNQMHQGIVAIQN